MSLTTTEYFLQGAKLFDEMSSIVDTILVPTPGKPNKLSLKLTSDADADALTSAIQKMDTILGIAVELHNSVANTTQTASEQMRFDLFKAMIKQMCDLHDHLIRQNNMAVMKAKLNIFR